MAKVIVIFSAKGGVGKTLIATNLAVSLSRDQNQRVCLLDLDMQVVGDMAKMLDVTPQRGLMELANVMKLQPQEQEWKREDYVIKTSFGTDFLGGVLRPQQSPHLQPGSLKEIFNFLHQNFDYIVVDAGKSFSEELIWTLNEANLILLVATPDILSIHQTKWTIDTLQFLHFPLQMIKIILNRAESLSGISWQEISMSLPAEIISQIPSEGRVVVLSINRGTPVVVDSPRTKISLAIKKLAGDLITDKNLFIEHREVAQIQPREDTLEKSGDFWRTYGLIEPLSTAPVSDETDSVILLKRRIHNRLIEEMNIKRLDLKVFSDQKKTKELKDKAEIMVTNILTEEAGSFISSAEARQKIVKEILDEALGLGPLEDLLAEQDITDIMVNNKDEIYIEKHGRITLTSKRFISNDQVKTIIERIIAPIGRRIDESVPMVDARLTDGSRVNAIIPPLSLTGPTLTIRKFRREKYKIDELIGMRALNKPMGDFLKACVICRKNAIVSGGTGSGKTTVLNILSEFIPDNERIITIEDSAELQLRQQHWVRLESRPPNIEGKGAVTIRDIFRNTLRMRPDRIIIGECRGLESLDMLQAMNTGHDGSMTTIHANSTHDVLSRLDSMILMSGVELPVRAIREMIASAIDIIVHTARLSDGSRKIIQITELTGMKDEMHIGLQDIFSFKQSGMDKDGRVLGDFQASGVAPTFLNEIRMKNIALPDNIFQAP